jgi:hypothetical protein
MSPPLKGERISCQLALGRASVTAFAQALTGFYLMSFGSPKGLLFEIVNDAMIRHVDLVL